MSLNSGAYMTNARLPAVWMSEEGSTGTAEG